MDSPAVANVDGFGGGGRDGGASCELLVSVDEDTGELGFSWIEVVDCETTGLGRDHIDMGNKPSGRDVAEVVRAACETVKRETKKRLRWTPYEHRLFLEGQRRHGNRWIEISQQCIPWKTPTQIGSHAQKYKLRQKTPAEKWIRDTVNNISEEDLTSEYVSPSYPRRQPPLSSASLPSPGGGPSTAQQSLRSKMSETVFEGSSSMPLAARDVARLSRSICIPAPAQQSSGGASMQGANIGGPALRRAHVGSQSRSNLQPYHNLDGRPERNYSYPMVHQEVIPWNQMPQLVAASSPGDDSPAPPMQWNGNVDLEPREQNASPYAEGSVDFDWDRSGYRAC